MAVKWTEEQQKVIDLRNRNILVSAAAGSGKTAVLVERIVQMLLDEKNPVDIDRLLISTFTNAAAAEMRERISAKLEEELEKKPDHPHLRRQLTLIHNAQITTIHGFCLYLVRNHFNAIDLDPGFRIGDEGELKLLKNDTMDRLLEQCYEEAEEDFVYFVECYAEGKSDSGIADYIMQVYEAARSHPQPKKWLEMCRRMYELPDMTAMEEKKWMKGIVEQIRIYARDYLELIREALAGAAEAGGPYMYQEALLADQEFLIHLAEAETYETASLLLHDVSWVALSRKRDTSVEAEKREQVKTLRAVVKKGVEKLTKQYCYQSAEEMLQDMQGSYRAVKILTELAEQFGVLYQQAKAARNLVDFNDLEHFALAILYREENSEMVRSETAKEYSRYFEEILIDEYQDINMIQELILNGVSKEPEGQNNVFMVGDVKQSIYKFRLSRPELFLQKYHSYSASEGPRQKIDLHKNFRSRSEVLTGVNAIFYQIMTEKLGNIEYNEESALYPGAVFPEGGNEEEQKKAEIYLLNLDKDLLKGGDSVVTERELEAKMTAVRIKELVGSYQVVDKATGKYRSANYSDIVILLRSMEGWADTFADVLTEEGVPAFTTSKTGYFSAIEIKTVLNYLRVLDNPRQDIPLAAAMHSPIGRFSGAEMAEIREDSREGRFYEAVFVYLEKGKNEEIKNKLTSFFEQVSSLRKMVSYTPVHELLDMVLEQTGYGDYVAAMPGGRQRRANLDMLLDKAAAYAAGSYKGLFHFIRYVEQLKRYNVDFGEASVVGENEDTVRIMSIHKSKGLEFPVVFVSGLGKGFNTQDARSRIMIHQDYGMGIDFLDPEIRIKAPTLLKKAIQKQITLENLAEELRVLYVALTRAKEKLILTGTVPKLEDKMSKLEAGRTDSGQLSFTQLSGAASYLDWLLPALMDEKTLKEYCISVKTIDDMLMDTFAGQVRKQLEKEELLGMEQESEVDSELSERLRVRMQYQYPYQQEAGIRTKVTVSELKKMGQFEEEDPETALRPEPDIVPLLPDFISGEEKQTGASRGTAYHRVVELLDFEGAPAYAAVKEQIEQLVLNGKLSREMADMVYIKHIVQFLKSDLCSRMKAAMKQQTFRREQSFVLETEANKISSEYKSNAAILVQGIIDAWFEEDGGIVLMDYKSDCVETAAELAERYRVQLDSYQQALEQLTGKKVKEKLIYSFHLGETIRL